MLKGRNIISFGNSATDNPQSSESGLYHVDLIQKKIAYFKEQLEKLPLNGGICIEVYYAEEDEAIFGTATLMKGICLRFAYDVDDISDGKDIVVFTLAHGDKLLLSSISKMETLIRHIKTYL